MTGAARLPIRLVVNGRPRELEAYKSHVIAQALKVLKGHDSIRCMFTTPKLLEALCERISVVKAGITGIFCGGTEMTPQFNRFAREELVPGLDFVPTYGNTLMGLACPKPFDPADTSASMGRCACSSTMRLTAASKPRSRISTEASSR